MQLISAGITWLNADIPIVDHPSAFFACNQNPRVAEQFNIMSIEMKFVKEKIFLLKFVFFRLFN